MPEVWAIAQRGAECAFHRGDSWYAFEVEAVEVERHDGGEAVTVNLEVLVTSATWGAREVGEIWIQTIELRSVPAPYGGVRWWFECGVCRKRRAHVYGPQLPVLPWMCRVCREAAYRSQQEHGASSRKGNGMGSVLLMMRRFDAVQAVMARRAYRRRFHRDRQRARLGAG
jgi:hypothetical protein